MFKQCFTRVAAPLPTPIDLEEAVEGIGLHIEDIGLRESSVRRARFFPAAVSELISSSPTATPSLPPKRARLRLG